MASFSPARLLSVWEHGAHRHPIDRALLLFAVAAPHLPPEQLPDTPIGARNAALMALRRECLGAQLASWLDCAACGVRLEFTLGPGDLPPDPNEGRGTLDIRGYRFTRPTSRHLARAADAGDPETAARLLLEACADAPDTLPQDDEAFRELLAAAGEAFDAADPWADLAITLRCPACGHTQQASFDIATYFWEELDSRARGLLDDVHTLAAAYGWTEADILSLSDARRSAYLARVSG
jgi:hypothetical protein